MNLSTVQLNSNPLASQDNKFAGGQSANGNGANGKHVPVTHHRRYQHFSWCGRDLDFFLNVISTHKPGAVTCKTCVGARKKLLTLRKKARAWEREHTSQALVVKARTGLVSVEAALQQAARQHHAVTERHL
jgi:hypothetical protein